LGAWAGRSTPEAIRPRGISMHYLLVPSSITRAAVKNASHSWSPSMYSRVEIPARVTESVQELLEDWDKGSDPGSFFYLQRSPNYLIRTKALQDYSALIYPKGDAIIALNPRAFNSPNLSDGDILLSKDSNIGECAIVDGDRWKNYSISGGLVRLRSRIDRFYLFAFLKHPLFRQQLYSMVPRGATIAHANTRWLDCKIPFPDQPDAPRVERYVSVLMEAIVDKERALRDRDEAILKAVDDELTEGQSKTGFKYRYPHPLRDSRARPIGRCNLRRGVQIEDVAGYQLRPRMPHSDRSRVPHNAGT